MFLNKGNFQKIIEKILKLPYCRNEGDLNDEFRQEQQSKLDNNHVTIEMEEVPKEIKQTEFSINNIQTFMALLNLQEINKEIQNKETVLVIKIRIENSFEAFDADNLEKLSSKFVDTSVIIFLASKRNNNFLIYWKSKDIPNFLFLDFYFYEISNDINENIFNFLVDFLAKSLSKGRLGLCKNWKLYSSDNVIWVDLIADSQDHNLLMIAAEAGNAEMVKTFLNFGTKSTAYDGVSAQDLAWKNHHSEVLLILAQANLTYPKGIDINELSDNFKRFYNTTSQLHAAITDKNEEKVKKILNCSNRLEFYFDLTNKSAANAAVEAKAFNIYEILLMNEIYLAPHECQKGVFDELSYMEQEVIRQIHKKHSKELVDKHIYTLMQNSSIAHDVTGIQEKQKLVAEAYKYLSRDPQLNIILKIVASKKNFTIIFDFNRNAVNITDPTSSDSTLGVFYFEGTIYIGAKQLLDESRKHFAIGTLIHELCHYAVYLVYSNQSKPYTSKDKKAMQEFEQIVQKCKASNGKENIIDVVFKKYPVSQHHSEVIVRPPHLIGMYSHQPDKLKEIQNHFPELFDYFGKMIENMKNYLENTENCHKKQKPKKYLTILNIIIIILSLSFIGSKFPILKSQFGKVLIDTISPQKLNTTADIISFNSNLSTSYKYNDELVNLRIYDWDRNKNSLKFYQKSAIIALNFINIPKLSIMRETPLSPAEYETILKNNIVYKSKKDNKIKFTHRIFMDYFLAKYFIDNIYEVNKELNYDEAVLRLQTFFNAFLNGKNMENVSNFIIEYIDDPSSSKTSKFHPLFSDLLRTKFKKIFFHFLNSQNPEIFEFLLKFFSKDHEVFTEMLHVNESETVCTATFNPFYHSNYIHCDQISKAVKEYLSDQEFKGFVKGTNQKGVIYFGMIYYSQLNISKPHDEYSIKNLQFNETFVSEFLKENGSILTKLEKTELLITLTNPELYSLSTQNYEIIWTKYKHLLSKENATKALGNAFAKYLNSYYFSHSIEIENFLINLIKISENFLNSSEIHYMIINENLLHRAAFHKFTLENMWNFFKNHSTFDQQKDLLLIYDQSEKIKPTEWDISEYFEKFGANNHMCLTQVISKSAENIKWTPHVTAIVI
ncbi:uncharacterized protein [Chironomus tepperi]|uniref:uncharacterized protein n=1 Tax=Chironomus tepperi TaxID=113505 RepID=UPI00391FB520